MGIRNDEIERTKRELAELLGKLKRNIEGVGSLRQLKKDYPLAYKRVRHQILVAVNDFKDALFLGYKIPSWDDVPRFQEEFNKYEKRLLREALPKCDVDLVQQILEEFLTWSISQGGIFIPRIAYPELYEEKDTENIAELPLDEEFQNLENGSTVVFSVDKQTVKE